MNPVITIPPGDFLAFVFDCDGTLADTMPLHYRAWCETVVEHGVEFPETQFYEMGGATAGEIVQILNEQHGCRMPIKETASNKESIFHRMISLVEPIEPVVRLAHEHYGRVPLAVASGGSRVAVESTLKFMGILDLFSAVVTNEDYVQGKPAPDAYLEAARRLGVRPERCLAFEDTSIGVQAAESAGMTCILIPQILRALRAGDL